MKMKRVFQVFILALFVFVLVNTASSNTVGASSSKSKDNQSQVLISETITLQNKRSHFNVGFVRVDFKKDALPEDAYPITFEVKVYAENGKVYIEFSPDVDDFFKDVKITVRNYEGFIYDVGTDEYIFVDIDRTVFYVSHFSRWCFAW